MKKAIIAAGLDQPEWFEGDDLDGIEAHLATH